MDACMQLSASIISRYKEERGREEEEREIEKKHT
jgi:hypothetical protein